MKDRTRFVGLALAVLGMAVTVLATATPAGAIVGGQASSYASYPYFAMFTQPFGLGPSCGGSVIADSWVLTAAHCVYGQSTASVSVPAANQSATGDVIPHPLYDGHTSDGHDLALIQFRPGALTGVTPVRVGAPWDASAYAEGIPATVIGVGRTSLHDSEPWSFRSASTILQSDGYMDGIFNPWYGADHWNEPLMIGAGTSSHTVCVGDSGGPLVVTRNGQPVQVGVASFTEGGDDGCTDAGGFAELSGAQLAWVASRVPSIMDGWGGCLSGGEPGQSMAYYGDSSISGAAGDGGKFWSIWCSALGSDGRPSVLSGDFNRDGRADLVLTGVRTQDVVPVAMSRGDGELTVSDTRLADFNGWSRVPGVHATKGDFNGDGRADIALLPGPNTPWWYTIPVAMSNGDGTFSVTNANQWDFAGWVQGAGVKIITGDFNADGRTDIVLLPGPNMPWWYTIPVALSNGDGSFRVVNLASSDFSAWAQVTGVQALSGDFNHDGRTDISLLPGPATPWWYTLPVAFSNGDGSFAVTNNAVGSFTSVMAQTPGANAVTGDFNHDGRTDIGLTGGSGETTIVEALSVGDGTFSITSSARVLGLAGKCMDVYYGNTANGTRVQLFTCHGGTPQRWTVGGDGTIRALGKCLDVYGGGTANSTPVDLWDCNGSAAQVWRAEGGQLINPQSGKCLDVTDASTADWTPLEIWPCNGNAAQQWRLPTAIGDFPGWAHVPGVHLLTGDFNNDGNTDISLLPPRNTPWWYTIPIAFSNGDATFHIANNAYTQFANVWAQAPGVAVLTGDFNADGNTDLALAGGVGWTTVPIAFANGDGTFRVTDAPSPDFAAWAQPRYVVVPDVRADTIDDAADELATVGLAVDQPIQSVIDAACTHIDKVISQSPAANTWTSLDWRVSITVGQQPLTPCL